MRSLNWQLRFLSAYQQHWIVKWLLTLSSLLEEPRRKQWRDIITNAITNEHNVQPMFLTTTQPLLLSDVSIASVSNTELSDMFDLIIKTCGFLLQEFNIFFLDLFLHSH
jgi:hypothetical protein